MGDLEAEPSVGQGEDVGHGRTAAAGIGDDDDLELEPLRRVDREQAHGVRALLLRDRVGLPGPDGLLPVDEADEPLQVGAAQLLVRTREAPELAEVRVPALAVVAREHREVVVVLAEHPLAEELERRVGRELEQAVVALPERQEQAPVVVREVAGMPRSMPRKIGWRWASARIRTSASFETPTNGEASTVSSASSSYRLWRSRRYARRSTTCCWPK